MNLRRNFSDWFDYERPVEREKTLAELEDEIQTITDRQQLILNCKLSSAVTELALKELEEHKKQIKTMMHKLIDEL